VSDRDCPLVTLAYGTYVARAGVTGLCLCLGSRRPRVVGVSSVACPGPMAMGRAGFLLSHPRTSTMREASTLEPEVRRRHRIFVLSGDLESHAEARVSRLRAAVLAALATAASIAAGQVH
jgi:hypothetical protein